MYVADAVQMSQLSQDARLEAIPSSKGFYQIESMIPGSTCRYTCIPLHQRDTTLNDFRVILHIDFPPDADMEKELDKLENYTQELKQIY